jgi:hypothetical protein
MYLKLNACISALLREPVAAHVTLDPTIIGLGVSYHW